MISKPKIFLILCIAFIGGIFLGRFINYQIMAGAAMIFVITGTIFYGNRNVLIISTAGLIMLIGAFRFISDFSENDMVPFYGQEIIFSGIVSEEPDERSDKTFLTLNSIVIDGRQLESKILLTVSRFPQYSYGDWVALEGTIQQPAEFEDFSYKNYLSRFGINAVMYKPDILASESGHGHPLKHSILAIKKNFIEKLSHLMPEPQNAFLGGLLVGLRRSIPEDLMELFAITGITHIIAISGFNITIIAKGVERLLEYFGKRISFLVSLLAISVFVVMAGGSPSVVRAGVMGALLILAANIGRVYVITNALVFTAAVMVALNPKILHFDVGFQLSFLALMGLVYLVPVIEPYFYRIPKLINQFLVPTIAAQIFVLPLLLYYFDRLSVVATLTNILVLPIIPLCMLLGFIAGLLALVFPPLALPFVWLTWLLLTYIIYVVEITAKIPYASVEIPGIGPLLIGLYYLMLGSSLIIYYYPGIKSKIIKKWSLVQKNS